ncbi:MAG: peptidoglycan editing factor PgeF [Drouetiella hepatica Uher 2000/2452]|jgi:hypothetical protein|uniref:Purine nucleoside phosphorylase n=1 Tax=Drouetiella hepatica Uher 2000/2452 TaxID=904376 RepID=A0A951QHW3_9CYAN|nr:peptidoglycan editing factor PgeF [Drouetiella hepatica Uher 2000/2452]
MIVHTWNWQTEALQSEQEISYLTCSLLQEWRHGFFTGLARSPLQPAPSDLVPSNLVEILQPAAPVYRIKQVHGNRVLSAAEVGEDKTDFQEADGLVSDRPHQSLWVCSADCTPVLIADSETGQVAAVHAGWRGTSLKIVPMAIARLQAQGSQLKHLRIGLGPAIAGEVYQVSTTVAAQVGATILTTPIAPDAAPDAVLDILKQLPSPPILDDPQPGRAKLDVRRVNELQLQQLGISAEQIAIAPYCTFQNPDLFFSYRRTQQKQVQWSAIVSRAAQNSV